MDLLKNLGVSALFGFLGIVILIVGYKLFDWVIPLDFNKELEKNNLSVAIVIAAMLLGIALIVSHVVA
ncbi:DUF350 domain-containing protein [Clostridium sp. 19966]|uniref:DUF350 domain-containing protein n=1 Tax=Clostridium sp. 19966 TaxID=2768166 RepID=UPI0028DDE3B3|nr:DUF350 domain-containing protein [Clostridium sp. 19966]MDT8718871.1 DUF350 domain-containing protein [Clostridium sp. 19966]